MRQIFTFVLAALSLFGWTSAARANFEVRPAIIEIEESNGRFESQFEIVNPREKPIAIEIAVKQRVFLPDGGEELVAADDDFLIFPLQTALAPGERQLVRISYLDPSLESSRSFRLIVGEVLAPLEASSANAATIRTRFEFNPSLHVIPKGAEARLAIENVRIENGADGKNFLRLDVVNSGNRYAYLSDKEIVIGEYRLPPERIIPVMAPRPVGPGNRMSLEFDIGTDVVEASAPATIRTFKP